MTKLLLALLVSILPTQPAPTSMTGTWVADLKGTTFMRLELRTENGRLIGALGTGDIHLDKNGVVDDAKVIPATLTPLANIVVARGVMSFTRTQGDDDERFQLRVTGERTAELTFLPSDEDLEEMKEVGIPAPKPIPLRKLR
jgi:hypothetical protein